MSPLYIEGEQLAESETERDLGVIFSTNLKWKDQVLTSTNKADQRLGRIKNSFAYFECELLKSLYVIFIRPFIEFEKKNSKRKKYQEKCISKFYI